MDRTASASHAGMTAGHRHDARYAPAGDGPDAARLHAAAQHLRARAPAAGSRLAELRHQTAELSVHIDSLTQAFERASDEGVRAHLSYLIRLKSRHLADLEDETAELERLAPGARGRLRRGQARPARNPGQPAPGRAVAPGKIRDTAPGHNAGAAPGGSAPTGRTAAGHGLAGRGTDPVSGHEPNVAATTDISPGPPGAGRRPAARRAGAGLHWAHDAGAAAAGSAPPGSAPPGSAPPGPSRGHAGEVSGRQMPSPGERTGDLVSRGRRSTYRPRLSRRRKAVIGAAAAAMIATIAAVVMATGSPGWPASVATVQVEAAKACQNPNVASEPGQVNFACAKATRQILWVFALMTSGDNPHFTDARTGRVGLEPITPALGGEVAWSLNLHHPYNPDNPLDSLEVAARAINNIIGGATLTGADGQPVVQPGLESSPADCARYTGSAAVISHHGFPGRCARPVTTPAGQAALVADVYGKWIVGSPPWAAQAAAVLFENTSNPGDPQVQAILRKLRHSGPLA
jgi:hypothetical protein